LDSNGGFRRRLNPPYMPAIFAPDGNCCPASSLGKPLSATLSSGCTRGLLAFEAFSEWRGTMYFYLIAAVAALGGLLFNVEF
jgi:hypothetical protein